MASTRAAYRTTAALCEHCGKQFKAYRASAKYCSEACKQKAKRDRAFRTVAKDVRELRPTPAEASGVAIEDLRSCRFCSYTGIVKDAAGQELAAGAHVATTGLCWFCWVKTPAGEARRAAL